MKKKLLAIILALTCLFTITNVYAMPKPTAEFYINDYANLLSDETKSYILNTSVALEKETTAQVVVVTVPSLDGKSIEEYATELFRSYGIGDSKKNNGLLLLLALEERKFRVEVGYGLEETLPDGLTGRYQDQYIIPYLKENNWDEGIKNGYTAFVKKLCEFYNVDSLILEEVGVRPSPVEVLSEKVAIALVLGTVFGTIMGILIKIKSKRKEEKKAKNIVSIITIISNIATSIILTNIYGLELLFTFLFGEVIMIMIILVSGSAGTYTGRGGRYRSSSFGGGSSGGGFRGGGGRSGGGGSTRGF